MGTHGPRGYHNSLISNHQNQDQDSASGRNVLRVVGVGILPQPSSYKKLTRLYLERRAIQLGCNAGMAIRLPLPLGGKVLAGGPGNRLYTSLTLLTGKGS